MIRNFSRFKFRRRFFRLLFGFWTTFRVVIFQGEVFGRVLEVISSLLLSRRGNAWGINKVRSGQWTGCGPCSGIRGGCRLRSGRLGCAPGPAPLPCTALDQTRNRPTHRTRTAARLRISLAWTCSTGMLRASTRTVRDPDLPRPPVLSSQGSKSWFWKAPSPLRRIR